VQRPGGKEACVCVCTCVCVCVCVCVSVYTNVEFIDCDLVSYILLIGFFKQIK
jgi:hypothetical protein